MARARSATTGDAAGRPDGGGPSLDSLPSIRFSTFYDPRATRPSLKFAPVSRTLPTGKEVIRVGRYSERDAQPNVPPNTPSAAPVGFKSKVVSRRHCEFWFENGKWYIKDVKSSSGTFLNHIRLSPPGTESKPYPVNDGDIVQLGIDFKGGEEMIFRCVKMRLELNRGWQNKLNTFK
jgi:pSer/pThr/pTyr-binding forkhead associated (FHA) protein